VQATTAASATAFPIGGQAPRDGPAGGRGISPAPYRTLLRRPCQCEGLPLALALAAAYVAHTTIGLLTAEAGFPLMISAFRLELVDLVDLHLIGVAKIS
jgi:hypothetical protein